MPAVEALLDNMTRVLPCHQKDSPLDHEIHTGHHSTSMVLEGALCNLACTALYKRCHGACLPSRCQTNSLPCRRAWRRAGSSELCTCAQASRSHRCNNCSWSTGSDCSKSRRSASPSLLEHHALMTCSHSCSMPVHHMWHSRARTPHCSFQTSCFHKFSTRVCVPSKTASQTPCTRGQISMGPLQCSSHRLGRLCGHHGLAKQDLTTERCQRESFSGAWGPNFATWRNSI
mmetsp:Transcript_44409/g.78097  ORF Transcript_44409/g.78097 Transcript_44409/m.78097 type:complete len:230 (+) Transcript_44409:4922-5611(+)